MAHPPSPCFVFAADCIPISKFSAGNPSHVLQTAILEKAEGVENIFLWLVLFKAQWDEFAIAVLHSNALPNVRTNLKLLLTFLTC
jgi:hypothetical protein